MNENASEAGERIRAFASLLLQQALLAMCSVSSVAKKSVFNWDEWDFGNGVGG